MSEIGTRQEALRQALADLETWLEDLRAYDGWEDTPDCDVAKLSPDLKTLEKLRTRATSGLLRVALAGEMSSGKSRLVSALCGQLRFELRLDERNRPQEKFVGLLPSTTEAASSCPVSVEPVSDGSDITFNVKFASSMTWERIAVNPSASLIAAYLTDISERVGERLDGHHGKVVIEAQLLVPAAEVAAILYDLPGVNAPGRRHEIVARRGWRESDCFIYVTPATATLKESELELVAELYNEYVSSGGRKKVVWVTTAIDTASDLDDDDVPRWRTTVKRNTRFLRDFVLSVGGDLGFVGRGFIGVSPQLEARSVFRRTSDTCAADEDQADSRMDELRHSLRQITEDGTGLKHLGAVAATAAEVLGRYERPLQDASEALRLTSGQAREEVERLHATLEGLEPVSDAIRHEFSEKAQSEVTRVASQFGSRNGLANHLHRELDQWILGADLLSPRVLAALEMSKTKLSREWMTRNGGVLEAWENALRRVEGQINLRIQEAVDRFDPESLGRTNRKIDLELFKLSRGVRTPAAREDLTAKTVSVLASVFPIAGAATTAVGGGLAATGLTTSTAGVATIAGVATSAAVGLAIAPVGLAVAAGGIYAWRQRRGRIKTSLELMRQEEIAALDQGVTEAATWFTASALSIADDQIELAAERVSLHCDELRSRIIRRRAQISSPEGQNLQAREQELARKCERAADIHERLDKHIEEGRGKGGSLT